MIPIARALAEDFAWSWLWHDRQLVFIEVLFALTFLVRLWFTCIQGAFGNEPIDLNGSWTDGTRQRRSTIVSFANGTMWVLVAAMVAIISLRVLR